MNPKYADVVARYKGLRKLRLELNNRLVKSLSREELEEGATRLGLFRNGTIVLESEDLLSVVMDYCLHDVRRNGQNAIQRYLTDNPPQAVSEDSRLLERMLHSKYTIIAVDSIEPGVGVHARDLIDGNRFLLVDLNFSLTAEPDATLATRLLFQDDGTAVTSGAFLPIGKSTPVNQAKVVNELEARLGDLNYRRLSPDKASHLVATIIKLCLAMGAAEMMGYDLPEAHAPSARTPVNPTRKPQYGGVGRGAAGRNDPCPCGSGKKYKKCCGA